MRASIASKPHFWFRHGAWSCYFNGVEGRGSDIREAWETYQRKAAAAVLGMTRWSVGSVLP